MDYDLIDSLVEHETVAQSSEAKLEPKFVSWGNFVNDFPQEEKKTVMLFLKKPPIPSIPVVPEWVPWGRPVAFLPRRPQGQQFVDLLPKGDSGETLEPIYTHLGGSYYKGEDGYYVVDSKGNFNRFTDFLIEIETKESVFATSGKEEDVYCILLTNEDGEKERLRIPSEEWCDLLNHIEKHARKFLVFGDEISGYREKFKRLSGIILKEARYAKKVVRKVWGWGEPLKNGARIFYHGGMKDCRSSKALPPRIRDFMKKKECLLKGWRIFEVGPAEVIVPMVLYSLASYVDAIFTDAGYPLASCLMLIGNSGFLKTSSAEVIFSPAVFPVNRRIYSVRGTQAVFNVLHEIAYDDTLVVDDFNLEGTKADVQHKLKVMRDLIRGYADKTPRAKYGGNDNVKQYGLRGGCVFTGETKMTGQLKSSELRYLKVVFQERLNGEKLALFQSDPQIWLTFCAEFIYYLEDHYLELRELITETFQSGRSSNDGLEPRLLDMYLHLSLVADILARFLSDNAVMAGEESLKWLSEAKSVVYTLIFRQSEDAKVQDPHKLYLEELWNLLGTGAVHIAPDLATYINDMAGYIGYQSEDVYMLKKDEAFKAVRDAFWSRGESFPVAADDISKALKEHDLSKFDAGSCLKKAPSKIKGRPRMLALITCKCEKVLEELG